MAAPAKHQKLLVLEVAANTDQGERPAGGLQLRAWVEDQELFAWRQGHREPDESTGEVPHRALTELRPQSVFFGPSGRNKYVRRDRV